MSLCILCMGYESDGADYEVRQKTVTASADENETESEHEVESGIEYKFRSDEEPGSESEVDPNEVKDINENDAANEEKGDEVPSDDEDKLSDEIKQLLDNKENKDSEKSKDEGTDRLENEEPSDDEDQLPDEIKQLLNKGKATENKQNEKEKSGDGGKKDEEENDESSDSDGEKQLPDEIREVLGKSVAVAKDENISLKMPLPRTSFSSSALHRSSEHDNNDRHRRYTKNLYLRVKFPTGNSYSVTVPQAEEKQWKCGDKTKLITLRPDGKIGKREYRIIAKEMEKTRVNHISGSFSGYEIVKIQKIVNPCLWKKYRHRRKEVMMENHDDANERMLFHGSPAYHEMIEKGFDERYSSPNGMFGAGLYFARNSSKSNQYVYGLNGGTGCPTHKVKHCMICERTLILCRLTLGRTQKFTSAQYLAHPPAGFHSVEGVPTPGGLVYSETIVYRGEQVYPEFLITYKLKP